MEHNFSQGYTQGSRRSAKMESMAFTFGLLSIASLFTVYGPLILGSLCIVFALLSRGGEYTFSKRAKTSLVMGIASLTIVFCMFAYTFAFAELYFGGIENMMQEVYTETGIDYNVLLEKLE